MIRLFLLLAFLVVPLVACDEALSPSQPDQFKTDQLVIVTQGGARHGFHIELALTPEQMQKGLMFREEMARDHGMLFYFGEEGERGFWMRNTLIPLDLLFIRQDGTIHRIHAKAVPKDETSIRSQGAVAGVLEINGGMAADLGIAPGDRVHHAFFGNPLADQAIID